MKKLVLLFLLVSANAAFSQNYFYLEDVKLKEKVDFTANEGNAVKAIDFLMSTPAEENVDRKACIRFILRYAEGSPITVTLDSYFTTFYKKNLDLLPMYIGLWVKSAIGNPDGKPEDHEKYIYSELYKYIKAGNNIKSNDKIKSLITAGDAGTIDDWLKKNVYEKK